MNHIDLNNIVKVYQPKYSNELFIEASITNACRLNCKYCINPEVNTEKPRKFLCLEKLHETILYLNKTYFKNIIIEITGGEPTMHPQLMQFCGICNQACEIKIITNLTRDSEYYRNLLQYGNIKLCASFHYINLKQMQVFIEKILKIHEEFKQKIDSVFIMLIPENFEECVKIYQLLKTAGIKTYGCRIHPNGRYNPKYSINQVEQMQKMLQHEYDDVYIENCNGNTAKLNFFNLTNNINFKHWKCAAGLNQLYIDIDGNIYPCKNVKNKICNINNISTARIKPIICPHIGQCTEEITYREKLFK